MWIHGAQPGLRRPPDNVLRLMPGNLTDKVMPRYPGNLTDKVMPMKPGKPTVIWLFKFGMLSVILMAPKIIYSFNFRNGTLLK
ncbi:hypothetical protein CVD19_05110 [Bacillus sp. T33-2]|nr:hypothetical protein CVD19_05110 [Bacillus sp. T33-2]